VALFDALTSVLAASCMADTWIEQAVQPVVQLLLVCMHACATAAVRQLVSGQLANHCSLGARTRSGGSAAADGQCWLVCGRVTSPTDMRHRLARLFQLMLFCST
jgi:hypothetical protein